MSSEYILLLRQRRPEALAVLTYYAVLLHYAKDHWLVHDFGKFLIDSISDHLGEFWSDWLDWPRSVLANSQNAEATFPDG